MADILSRGDIVDTVAAQVDMPQTKVDAVIKAFESAVARQLGAGGEIRMAGFGTFKVSQRSARTSRNPRTGEPVQVAARTAPSFKAGKALKDAAASSSAPAAKKAPAKADAKAPAKATKAPAAKAPAAKAASSKSKKK